MSSRALIIAGIVYGLLLSALLARDGVLLSLAIPFMVSLVLGLLKAPSAMNLAASRTFDRSSVNAGEPVECKIVIQNQGAALLNLQLMDEVFTSTTILDGEVARHLSLPAGEAAELRYVFGARRGVYSFTALRARAADPFGLFEFEQEPPAPYELIVRNFEVPAGVKRNHSPHSRSIPAAWLGPVPILGVREYRAGDPLSGLTGGSGHGTAPVVNEYERELQTLG
jgi:uncharacterized protein (DUF58 family)